jgi:hypothetical protein
MKNDQYITNTLKPTTDGLVVTPSEVGFSIYGGGMQNSTVNLAAQRISELSTMLQNPETAKPVFVRFQQAHQFLTIPVTEVAIQGKALVVKVDDGSTYSIKIELLLDIVAFRDAMGKPVFLMEFPTGGDIAAEYRDEIERENRRATAYHIKHQLYYLTTDPKINEPEIRKSVDRQSESWIDEEKGGGNERLAA